MLGLALYKQEKKSVDKHSSLFYRTVSDEKKFNDVLWTNHAQTSVLWREASADIIKPVHFVTYEMAKSGSGCPLKTFLA